MLVIKDEVQQNHVCDYLNKVSPYNEWHWLEASKKTPWDTSAGGWVWGDIEPPPEGGGLVAIPDNPRYWALGEHDAAHGVTKFWQDGHPNNLIRWARATSREDYVQAGGNGTDFDAADLNGDGFASAVEMETCTGCLNAVVLIGSSIGYLGYGGITMGTYSNWAWPGGGMEPDNSNTRAIIAYAAATRTCELREMERRKHA